MSDEMLVPTRLVKHLAIVAIANIADSADEKWWLTKVGSLFFQLNPVLTQALEPYSEQFSFRYALISRAPGVNIAPNSDSFHSTLSLLEGADKTCCNICKEGVCGMQLQDGSNGMCGFSFIIGFSPPPGMKPWNYLVAANRKLVPSEKLQVPQDDGSISVVTIRKLYPKHLSGFRKAVYWTLFASVIILACYALYQ